MDKKKENLWRKIFFLILQFKKTNGEILRIKACVDEFVELYLWIEKEIHCSVLLFKNHLFTN